MAVSRRDWLRALLGAPLAAGLPPSGCGAGRTLTGELYGPSIELGHRLFRDGDRPNGEPRRERVEVAIIGGGPAGLSAAWRLRRAGVDDVRVYEMEPQVGGTSASGESRVTPYPWGAHYLPVPGRDQPALRELLAELGAYDGEGEDGEPLPAEHMLVRAPDERLFYRGYWTPGLWPAVGSRPEDEAQRRRFQDEVDRWVAFRDGEGRRAFTLPVRLCSDDAAVRALDRLTAAEWLDERGLDSPMLRWWLDYGLRDDHGLSLDDASAWSLMFYHAARVPSPGEESAPFITWPEGNGRLVRHLAKRVGGARIRLRHAAVAVRPNADGAVVELVDAERETRVELQARHVVVAVPRMIASRLVQGAPSARDATYGPWMVAQLHLTRRPRSRGFPLCWDNVLYDSPSLGYVVATHQAGKDHGATVFTYYYALTERDADAGRRRLHEHPWTHWADAVLTDLRRAHRDLDRCVERVDVWRWGHAMVQPRAGSFTSEARRAAARPIGAVHFAHSDLSGVALFEEAFDHGVRAADAILAARRPA